MNDIETKEDIVLLVNHFYDKIKVDPILGPIFTERIGDKWDSHLQTMYSFWNSILLGDLSYQGNPMLKHLTISEQFPLSQATFDIWINLFENTVQQHFEGPKSRNAVQRATNIARLMSFKINGKGRD